MLPLHTQKLISERDAQIKFVSDSYSYYINGKKTSTSVTGLIEKFFNPFNSREVAATMIARDDFYDEERYAKYWPILEPFDKPLSQDDTEKIIDIIAVSWEENGDNASQAGTNMHESIEDFYTHGKQLPDTNESKHFLAFHKYAISLGYRPLRAEQILWDADLNIAGCADMLYIPTDTPKDICKPKVWLVDWKRSKEIRKHGYGKHGTGLCSHKKDCNFEHYSLQLNIYKFLLQKNYGLEVTRMTLVILHPDQKTFDKFEVSDDQRLVERIFADVSSSEVK